MARVSSKFEKRVKGYDTGGSLVRSAEGRSISRSQKSVALGKALSRKNLKRVSNLHLG